MGIRRGGSGGRGTDGVAGLKSPVTACSRGCPGPPPRPPGSPGGRRPLDVAAQALEVLRRYGALPDRSDRHVEGAPGRAGQGDLQRDEGLRRLLRLPLRLLLRRVRRQRLRVQLLEISQDRVDVQPAVREGLPSLPLRLLHVVALPEDLGFREGHAQASRFPEGFRAARPVAGSASVRSLGSHLSVPMLFVSIRFCSVPFRDGEGLAAIAFRLGVHAVGGPNMSVQPTPSDRLASGTGAAVFLITFPRRTSRGREGPDAVQPMKKI